MDTNRTFTPHGAPIHEAKLLPVLPPTPVIGRNRELGSAHVTLKAGNSVFLSGDPGIGKTALAAVLAMAYIASSPSGVLWFNVIEDDLTALIARVGRAYGLSALTGSNEDPSSTFDMIQAVLEQNRPLIVLDGLIDIEATHEFADLCASKAPLLIANERTAPGPWTSIALQPLTDDDSLALFKQISGLTDSLYNLDIAGLVKFLGGNPLAIELAACEVVVDDMLPAEILTTLPSSSGHDGASIMMAMVFKRMPPPVQAMLMVLAATFTGGATAELISDLSNVPAANIIPLMRQLVSRGVALEFDSIVYGQFAYTLHEVAQNYTRNWLQQYQRLQGIENRALKAVITYIERHAHEGTVHHDRLAAEMGNIVGAAAYATSTGQARALRQIIHFLNQDAENFLKLRGFGPELDQMIKLTSLLGASSTEATQVIPMVKSDQVTRPSAAITDTQSAHSVRATQPARPTTLPNQGIVEPPLDSQATPVVPWQRRTPKLPPDSAPEFEEETQSMGATQLAGSSLDETQLSATEDTSLLATADKSRSLVETPAVVIDEPPIAQDDTDIPTERSLPTLQGKLDEARTAGQTLRQAKLLHAIGEYHDEQGDRQQALNYHKQALELYESQDNIDGMLATLDTLAGLTAQADDAEGALVYATRGVNLAQRQGDQERVGRLLTRLGDVRLALGDVNSAAETYTQAVEALRSTEDWLNIGLVMSKLGNAYLELRRFQEAIMLLEQTLAIFQREHRPDYEGRVLGSIGSAYGGLQQWDKAQGFMEQSLTMARQSGDGQGEVAQLGAMAHVRQVQNDQSTAISYYREALNVAYQIEDIDLQAALTYELGTLLIDNPNTLMLGLQLLRESDEAVPNSEARRLIGRASKRLERASAAGLSVAPAGQSNREYAAAAHQAR